MDDPIPFTNQRDYDQPTGLAPVALNPRLAQLVAMFKALDERGKKTVEAVLIQQFKTTKGE